jgi:hypothetical protein
MTNYPPWVTAPYEEADRIFGYQLMCEKCHAMPRPKWNSWCPRCMHDNWQMIICAKHSPDALAGPREERTRK